ncbi:3'-5' exonuclease [Shimia marina]|uniref:DNA-directed DNA polymerase n=1 Tax=Shimia marina TaxID=321267 RepID=A0A0P1FEI2_9RHOB|nr:3'-5' exonuclease [Shimia marina]CUH54053.1 DNA polymerase III PolC-type [Shimia marina]SFE81630.1 DNA polymerase-3 subunit epsilon [Shimia marina]
MFSHLSLRLRMFLLFALMALGGLVVMGLALMTGYRSALTDGTANGFVLAGIVAAFGFLGLAAGVWLLFDENVAKPIMALSTTLRARAHAGVAATVDTHAARYLGDLAPAAEAISIQLDSTSKDVADQIAEATAALATDRAQLTALLTEIPVAILLIGSGHRIALYDGQAAGTLAQIAPPRLDASIFDYLDRKTLLAAHTQLVKTGKETHFEAHSADGLLSFEARLKPLEDAKSYLILIDEAHADIAPEDTRPLTFDFELLSNSVPSDLTSRALDQIPFVVFDCETTGLLPHKDELVQIGAVRVYRNQILRGEEIDSLIDPGRPIPAASTRVHHITDTMVRGAPSPKTAVTSFHHFARDAVIVAHNAPFDMAFMRRHGNEMNISWPQPILDTVLLSAVLFGITEQHTLDALCERLGVTIPPEVRHTAKGDAIATAEVLCKMLPMLAARGYQTLAQVLEQTRKHSRLLDDLN